MKRLVISGCIGTLIFGFAGSAPLVAQWQYVSGSSGPIVYTGGNVGIGTTSPGVPLAVSGSSGGSAQFGVVGENISNTPRGVSVKSDTPVAIAVGQQTQASVGLIWYPDPTLANASAVLYTFNGANPLLYSALYHNFALGNVGVGGNPGTAKLFVNGNVGIGTTAPAAPLSVLGNAGGEVARFVGSTDYANRRSFVSLFTSNPAFWWEFSAQDYLGGDAANGLAFRERSGSGSSIERVFLAPGGNVGIGTTQPAHLLHVNGTIGAKEVIVSSTGADYVFEPGYRLKPLTEVAEYIEANHHLPEIPSADEVNEKGMDVGEMEAKLLAKVEELTLHLIRQDHENRELREHVTQQAEQIQELRDGTREWRRVQ